MTDVSDTRSEGASTRRGLGTLGRSRRNWLIAVLAAGSVVGALGIAQAGQVSVTSKLVCFPTSGAIVVPQSGACPTGTTAVNVADKDGVDAVARRTHAYGTFLRGKYAPSITYAYGAVREDKTGTSRLVTVTGTNLLPGSLVTVTSMTNTRTATVNSIGGAAVTGVIQKCGIVDPFKISALDLAADGMKPPTPTGC